MSHKSPAQRAFSGSAAGQDTPFAHLAKVGVAGSNPVVRSKQNRRSGALFGIQPEPRSRPPAKIPSFSRLSFGPEPPGGFCPTRSHLDKPFTDVTVQAPKLEVRGVPIGEGTVDVVLAREDQRTVVRHLHGRGVSVDIQDVAAPIWGRPIRPRRRMRPKPVG
jgi:hypothetical protein